MFILHFENQVGGGAGGVWKNVTKCHRGEGGSKNCQKSVTYYLNGPLCNYSEEIKEGILTEFEI